MSEGGSIGRIVCEVEPDTSKLSLKLKAIAKHAEALADELDAIDAEDETEEPAE